jgi:hypothetical protein
MDMNDEAIKIKPEVGNFIFGMALARGEHCSSDKGGHAMGYPFRRKLEQLYGVEGYKPGIILD